MIDDNAPYRDWVNERKKDLTVGKVRPVVLDEEKVREIIREEMDNLRKDIAADIFETLVKNAGSS